MTIFELLKHRGQRDRLKEILHVFYKWGFGYLISKVRLKRYVPFSKRLQLRVEREKETPPEVRLRKAFEELGPTFLKFGQLLSLRPDLLPHEYIQEFEKMQDKVPAFSFSDARGIIEKEFDGKLEKLFTSFPKKPIASGSIAQVYKAKHKGKNVAVKVQRPGIKKMMLADIELMYRVASLLDKYVPELKQFSLKEIVHEFEKWTIRELDFKIEAHYAKKIKKNLAKRDVIVPTVIDERTSSKVLTMEFVQGVALHNLKKTETSIFRKGFSLFLQQVFIDGLFHADPHPGNILVKGKKLGLIDFGIIGHFDDELKQIATSYYQAVIVNDPVLATRVLSRLQDGVVPKKQFERDMREMFEKFQGDAISDIPLGVIMKEGMQIARKNKIRIPIDFVLFAKTILTLEGLAIKHCPQFNFTQESEKALKKLFSRKVIWRNVKRRAKKSALQYQELLERFPETANEILERGKQFKFMIDLEDSDLRDLTIEMERSSGNLSVGLIIAALIVGGSLLFAEFRLVGVVSFIVAGGLGLWLMKRTIFRQ